MTSLRLWPRYLSGLVLLLILARPPAGAADSTQSSNYALFARTNLVAWCIVPFDASQRGPEARAEMLERLGFQNFAYDYRSRHIPTFDAEVEALERHHVGLFAWWFPTTLNDEARLILGVIRRHHVHPQLWVMGSGGPVRSPGEQAARVISEANRIQPITKAAAEAGCVVALYNHGGWFGEPENQIAIIQELRVRGTTNIGIVYNQHHGHSQIDRFPALMRAMKPYLLALNLNGMVRDGDKHKLEILPVGQGDVALELSLQQIVRDSGWRGPVGLLNHTDEDAEARLLDNLEGLAWLDAQRDGASATPKPQLRTRREAQPGQGPPRK